MLIIPAIDIREGKVVRLRQGDFNRVTEYFSDPVIVAKKWQDKGAQLIHVVDLDGAKAGKMQNISLILAIIKSLKIPVQVGGGIREQEEIKTLLDGGAKRVILGTKAVEDKEFLKVVLSKWKDKIAVSVDCSNGFVSERGWTETSSIKGIDFVKDLEKLGVKCIIYTDISRDGMLGGPNYTALKELLKTSKINIIASGGVSDINDIKKFLKIKKKNLLGVITGRAIYEGKLDLKEALKLCSKKG
ncbi:MAG: 1-(5-phosphoribosyl)-5-[(5-phosphoribosylamino)methylideneamino]imidazole-4-carboxamide isomerase [Candidatus Omnitrophica bacterium]|nr:1-(5-phosphoribosyl)-5-[(5-phosphoribosylamino)methylideneamino]imidazole-4-carboxamide isomerase [Candidatus Omnitrophota bacterium]